MRGWVCRLVPTAGRFPPNTVEPMPDDFMPKSRDKAEAKAKGIDPMISVFDEELTTLEQAKAILGQPSAGFGLAVECLRELKPPGDDRPLKVVRDPLEGPSAGMPGADGHCGIQGLKRRTGVPRPDHRRFCLRLCDLAVARG